MKKMTAAAVLALATLAAPQAGGQATQPVALSASAAMSEGAAEAGAPEAAFKPLSAAAPSSTTAFLLALGFLGLVILRRTR